MWTAFTSKDPFKNFPYEIGERISYSNSSIWSLHDGIKLATKESVSIFVYENKPEASIHLLELVKNCIKRSKILRHPNFIKYLDSCENDKFMYLVVERVLPLENYLASYTSKEENQKRLAISWGLHQICIGLSFLLNECNLTHNNLCSSSIFVDKSGEWHLGGLEYITHPNEKPPSKVLSSLDKYVPPTFSKNIKWASDSWGLGCLIWEIFNGPLPKSSSLQSPGKIPDILISRYCELVGANANARPSPQDFLNQCKLDYMKNKFVDSMLFLEQIHIKDQNELSRFYNSFPNLIDSFPAETCKSKILQQIINSYEYGNAGSLILASLLKIGKLLDDKEFQTKIVPIVIKLFSSKDRATRAKLLQQIDQYIHHIPPVLVNDQIFFHIISGFTDSNPTIREQTIKSIIHLAPKLNSQNLNDEVMKHFSRIQSKDDQGGIRTNTTVCLGKIAEYIDPVKRQDILTCAFARALRDPFPPTRTAGILAFSATQAYYSLQVCATKVLPSLCVATIDPEKSIREHAFKSIRGFLDKLEKGYESPSSIQKVENNAATTLQSPSTFGWAEWAMTSLTSKFMKPTKAASGPKEPTREVSSKEPSTVAAHNKDDSGTSDYEDTVADIDWTLGEEETKGLQIKMKQKPTKDIVWTSSEEEAKGGDKDDCGWDDADWGTLEGLDDNIEVKPLTKSLNNESINKQSELRKSKSCDLKSSVQKDNSSKDEEWGDNAWGDDCIPYENSTVMQDTRKKRDEKREQRQKENQMKRQAKSKLGGGPLKLGAHRVP